VKINHLPSSLAENRSISADSPKLKSAAHEFEASLFQELLKPLQEDPLFTSDGSGISGGSADESDDQNSSNALMNFGSEAMAKAISERGGFGIATKILNHFRTLEKATSAASAGKL
jgi:hypothetical protein